MNDSKITQIWLDNAKQCLKVQSESVATIKTIKLAPLAAAIVVANLPRVHIKMSATINTYTETKVQNKNRSNKELARQIYFSLMHHYGHFCP